MPSCQRSSVESFPEALHARLTKTAAAHRHTVTQETIHMLETALAAEPAVQDETGGFTAFICGTFQPGRNRAGNVMLPGI